MVSTNNAISSTLAGDEVFTGKSDMVSEYSQLTVNCYVTNKSATGGLQMSLSQDNVNWDVSKNVTVTSFNVHTLAITVKYFRIIYTNGPGASDVRLQVIYHKYKSKNLTSTTSQVISDQNDVELNRVVNDPTLDLARGVIYDKFTKHKFGHSDFINSTESTLWTGGGNYVFPQTAETIRIQAGGNANDDVAGTGALSIIVEGLDANWDQITDTIVTNGASASTATTNTYIRINRVYVESVGTFHGYNIGYITIENTSTNNVLAIVEAEKSQTQTSIYSVPAGHSAYLTRVEINLDAATNKTGDVMMFRYENAKTGSPRRIVWRLDSITEQHVTLFESYISFEEKEDVVIRATATATSSLSANYDLIVVDNIP